MTTIARSLSLAAALAFAAPGLAQTKGPYEVKSGVYEQVDPLSKTTVYFDDYGLKQAEYGTTQFGPDDPAKHALKIRLPDGTMYDIDLDEKTGTSMKIDPKAAEALAAVMGPAMMKDTKTTDLPSRQILGKSCAGKEITVASMRMTTRTWTWKGILLRSEMVSAGTNPVTGKAAAPMVIEVSTLNVGPVPAEKLQVPAGVKIQNLSGK